MLYFVATVLCGKELYYALLEAYTSTVLSNLIEKVAEINELEDLVATERGLQEKFLKKRFYWHDLYILMSTRSY